MWASTDDAGIDGMVILKTLFSTGLERAPVMRNYNPDIDSAVTAQNVGNTHGTMRAWVYVYVTDITGRSIRKRVSLGNDYNSTLESARDTMQRARAGNRELSVNGDFRISI